jgi:hypothetical protein
MRWHEQHTEDAQLAKSLQQIWPHREHESGVLRLLMCSIGLHRWLQPAHSGIAPRRAVRFCLWCCCVEIDGIRHC